MYKDFALVAIMEFPGTVLAVVFCKKFGRKNSTLGMLLLGGVSCLIIPSISKDGAGGVAR